MLASHTPALAAMQERSAAGPPNNGAKGAGACPRVDAARSEQSQSKPKSGSYDLLHVHATLKQLLSDALKCVPEQDSGRQGMREGARSAHRQAWRDVDALQAVQVRACQV